MEKKLQKKLALAGIAITFILLLILGFWLIVQNSLIKIFGDPVLNLLVNCIVFGFWGVLALIIAVALFYKAIPREAPRKVF